MKKYIVTILSVLAFAALWVTAQNVIMKIEFKDGTVKYIDTEDVADFSIMQLDEMPQIPTTSEITVTEWDDACIFRSGFVTDTIADLELKMTYVPDDPEIYTYTLQSRAGDSQFNPLTFSCEGASVNVDCQPAGITDPVYGEIWLAGEATYAAKVLGTADTSVNNRLTDGHVYGSEYELNLVYYAPEYDGSTKLESHSVSSILNARINDVFYTAEYDYTPDEPHKIFYNVACSSNNGLTKKVRGVFSLNYDSESMDKLYQRMSEGDYDFDISFDSTAPCEAFKVIPDGMAKLCILYEREDFRGNKMDGYGIWNDFLMYTAPFYGSAPYFDAERYSETLGIDAADSSLAITVSRLIDKGEYTTPFSATVASDDNADISGAFKFPAEVHFADGEKETTLNIPVDIKMLEEEKEYTVTASLPKETPLELSDGYGKTTYPVSVTFNVAYNSKWRPWRELASSVDYGTMGGMFSGTPLWGAVSERESNSSTCEKQYRFTNRAYSELNFDYILEVDQCNTIKYPTPLTGYNVCPVKMKPTDTHYYYNGTTIMLATVDEFFMDLYAESYGIDVIQNAIDRFNQNNGLNESYYNPETGTFHLSLVTYFFVENEPRLFTPGETLIYLPGYASPDAYEISMQYQGCEVVGNTITAYVDAYASNEVSSYSYGIVRGQSGTVNINDVASEIVLNPDGYRSTTERLSTLKFEGLSNGAWTVVAVGYNAGNSVVSVSSCSFDCTEDIDSNWKTRGTLEYTDDIFASIYTIPNYTWEVTYQENTETPGYIRLVNPYEILMEELGTGYIYGDNYLYVHTENPNCVWVDKSLLGSEIIGQGPWILTSQAALLYDNDSNIEESKLIENGLCGKLENGIISYPAKSNPMGDNGVSYFNLLAIDEASYDGRNWYGVNANSKFCIRFLDEVSQARKKAPDNAGAKALAKAVAKKIAMGAEPDKSDAALATPIKNASVRISPSIKPIKLQTDLIIGANDNRTNR